jgi:hypothetical protein
MNYFARLGAFVAPLAVALVIGVSFSNPAKAQQDPVDNVQTALHALAPALDQNVLGLALRAHDRAFQLGLLPNPNILTVIDYSRTSVEPRFWVFDLMARRLVFQELVAHGRNSGDNVATRFSNAESSLESSLGLYVTGSVYYGSHGKSLRLMGLDQGFNDRALARGIVVHAANYVSQAVASGGRLGRSWGCPALSPEIASKVIDTICNGSAMFAYYPDSAWMHSSAFLQGSPEKTDSELSPADGEGVGFRSRLALLNVKLLQWASVCLLPRS